MSERIATMKAVEDCKSILSGLECKLTAAKAAVAEI
jgi:hypothetical protein